MARAAGSALYRWWQWRRTWRGSHRHRSSPICPMGTHTRYTIPFIQSFYCALDTCSAYCFSLQPYGTVPSRYTIAHHTLLASNGPVRLIITVTRTKPAQQPSLIHIINDSGRDKSEGDEDTTDDLDNTKRPRCEDRCLAGRSQRTLS